MGKWVLEDLSREWLYRWSTNELRGLHNDLLSAEKEADLLADHFSTKFKTENKEDVTLQQFPCPLCSIG